MAFVDPDYSEIVGRIQQIYNSCSSAEQSMLRQILVELSQNGYSYTYEQLFLADFTEMPVSIDQFICNEEYLGHTNNSGNSVYPFWKQMFRDLFNSGNRYNEILLSGATRIGKTSSAVTIMAYMLYKLMLYRNPHDYFHKKAISRFTLAFANLTKDLAEGVAFHEFNSTLKASPWFQEHGTFTKSIQNPVYMPEGDKIDIVPASDAAHVLGMQVWCLVGNTKIATASGIRTLEECAGSTQSIVQLSEERLISTCAPVIRTKEVTTTIKLHLADGSVIEGTPEHMMLLADGTFKCLADIEEGDDLMEVEEWRYVEGSTVYQVSNFGRVRRLQYTKEYMQYGHVAHQTFPERLFKLSADPDGYLTADLQDLGPRRVHRLVAQAFIPNLENKEYVNHIDGNKSNNVVSNLEWVTAQENTHHFRTADCFAEARELHRQRQSASHKGQPYHPRSEEARLRLSIANRAENLPPERLRKIRENRGPVIHSAETRRLIGQKNAVAQVGKKFINNGLIEKRVYADECDQYIANGWVAGRLHRMWINNGQEEKLILSHESASYVGWVDGRLCK